MMLLFDMFDQLFPNMPEQEVKVSRKFVKLITDFAKNGKPTSYPSWKKLDLETPQFLQIDDDFTVEEGLPFQNRIEFWETLDVYWKHTLSDSNNFKDEL